MLRDRVPCRAGVDPSIDGIDHRVVDARDADLQLVPVVSTRRELGADDEQFALHLQHEVVHLTLEVGARETQRTARLIDGAVRGGPQVMLVDPAAVEQPCRAVVALLRVHLHRVLVPVIEPSACMSLHRVVSLPTLPSGLGGQRTGSA